MIVKRKERCIGAVFVSAGVGAIALITHSIITASSTIDGAMGFGITAVFAHAAMILAVIIGVLVVGAA